MMPRDSYFAFNLLSLSWRQAFTVQVKAMVEAGVDIIILETFRFLSEIKIALQVTKEVFAGPVIASMAFSDEAAEASNHYAPGKVALMLQKWGANVVGVNCGGGWGRVGEGGPAAIYDVAEEMVKAVSSGLPVLALPNGDANVPPREGAGAPDCSPILSPLASLSCPWPPHCRQSEAFWWNVTLGRSLTPTPPPPASPLNPTRTHAYSRFISRASKARRT